MSTQQSAQATFVTAHVDLAGARGPLLGGQGKPRIASGELRAPHVGLVLWRVIENVSVEKGLLSRALTPSEDGQSFAYSYAVQGGGGGLFPIDEAGHFVAELTAAFVPPAFMPEVGRVEIISTSVPQGAPVGTRAALRRAQSFSPAQLEGRLVRLPGESGGPIWFVERGRKRLLASPTCGRLRFGDGWQRLVQVFTDAGDAALVPDGPPVSLAEAAEGKLIYSWPAPETFVVRLGQKCLIDDPAPMIECFGERWRIKLIHLRPDELTLIPDGEPVSTLFGEHEWPPRLSSGEPEGTRSRAE